MDGVRLTYRRKIFIGMFLAAVIPMALFYVLSITALGAYSKNNLRKEASESMAVVEEALNNGMNRVLDSVGDISENGAVYMAFMSDDITESPAIYRQLYVADKANGRNADFCLYDADGNLVTYVGSGQYVEDKIATDWGVLFEAQRNPDVCVIRNAKKYQGTDREEFLRVGKAITGNNSVAGFVVAVIDSDNIDYMLAATGIEKMGVIHILDDFDEQIYSSMSVVEEEEYSLVQKELVRGDGDEMEGPKKEYNYYHRFLEDLRLHVIFRQYYKNNVVLTRRLATFGGFVALFSIVVCFVLSGFFSKRFYNPILSITKDIEKIGQGDYSARIDIKDAPKDELAVLSENINQMTATLEDNTQKLVERERELGNAHVNMLQAQLNPHFIYNTLDTVKWIGKANNVPEVATISSGLAKILRTSINSQQIVTLRQELELVKSYVDIQKIRFDDKFEFIMDIPDDIIKAKIPKLILQPVIENCIVHGFEDRTNGKILISGYRDDDKLRLSVKDDGCGIEKEELIELNRFDHLGRKNEEDNPGNNIGINNVNSIIQLHYGKEYGLLIESVPGKGTVVGYLLPYSE